MKRIILTAALLMMAGGCASTNGTTPPGPAAPAPTTAPATQASATLKPINKYCPIETGNEIDPDVTYLYKGQLIGFCCEDCVPKFKENPEKYMKDLK